MGRYLNVGIIQMPLSEDTMTNVKHIGERLDALMKNYHKPELIIGVEGGIGITHPEPIPGPATRDLARMAERYGVYFIPGSMAESHDDLPKGQFYNAAPVFGPQGELISVYRKMCPWYPAEENTAPGKEYVVFDIPEKQTKIGVQICYDAYFPEISRNEVLMGAEVLVKLTMDPDPLLEAYRTLPITRAVENQAFFVSTNGTGHTGESTLYGHSVIVDPEARVLWEGGREPVITTVTLDLDLARRSREHGTFFMDQTLKHLKHFNLPMPYANDIGSAPLYKTLSPPSNSVKENDERLKRIGVASIGRRKD